MMVHSVLRMAFCVAIASLPLMAFGGPAPDTDEDGVPDVLDNCSSVAQVGVEFCDDDVNGFGNVCDWDLTGDGAVNTDEVPLLPAHLADGGATPSDLNCDGATNTDDVLLIPARLGAGFPGPSGLPCAGSTPCQ